MVRTAGENRTRYTSHSWWGALSAELQRYAARKIDKFETSVCRLSFTVDKYGANLSLVRRVLYQEQQQKSPAE